LKTFKLTIKRRGSRLKVRLPTVSIDFIIKILTMVESNKPENAPEHCPGVKSEDAGKADACAGCPNQNVCASGEARKEDPVVEEVR
jgi:hypothetical protein